MLGDRKYPWTRYWADRDAVGAFAGFDLLPDPDSVLASALPMVRLDALDEVPLLILLGQPGMGKSTAVDEEEDRLRSRGVLCERVDLQGLDSGVLLRNELEASPVVTAWRDGSVAHLYVDGLDRALVSLSTVQRVLEGMLRASADRLAQLRLRIVCRTADWEDTVRQRLTSLWPSPPGDRGDSPPVSSTLELLGLSWDDVRGAARIEGLDAERLIEQVVDKGAEPLAAIPITMAMILDTFAEDGVLGTRTELYRQAVRRLAVERDPLRRRERQDLPGADVLLAAAAREAAALMLCDRAALSDADEPLMSDIALAELVGGTELRFGGQEPPVRVERQDLRAALRTALLRIESGGRGVFIHHTFAEYLCAMWLAGGRLDATQVESLILNPHDPQRRLLSHLRDVAGWLAVLRPQVFGTLIKTQAEALLRGDLSLLESESRATLVEALLARAAEEHLDLWDRRIRDNLRRLGHPGLVEQIRPALLDSGLPVEPRRLAIALAEMNRLIELQDDLTALALSRHEPAYLRDDATRAAGRVGDLEHRKSLLPLALDPVDEDRDDEIKGAALNAVWPGLVDTATLLEALTPPKRTNFFGAYRAFLMRVHEGIPTADLTLAVRWSARQPREGHRADAISDLVDEIVRRAWGRVDHDDELADALAELFAIRLRKHHDLVSRRMSRRETPILDDATGRRRIMERLIPEIGESKIHPRWVPHAHPRLLLPEDAEWLVGRFLDERDPERRSVWADLVEAAFWPETWPVDVVITAAEQSPTLAERLRFWLGSVNLDSDEARMGRENYAASNPAEDSEEEIQAAQRVDVDAAIEQKLARSDDGDYDAWWQLNLDLLWDDAGQERSSSELEPRIVVMPGWKRAGADTRERIVRSARAYLEARDAEPSQWIEEHKGWRPAWAGYRAMVLLLECSPAALDDLSDDRWAAWAPAIVGFPRASEPETKVHASLLRLLLTRAPGALVKWALRKLRADDARGADPWEVGHLRPVLSDRRLQHALLDTVVEDQLQPKTREFVFGMLLDADADGAVEGALRVLAKIGEGSSSGTETVATGLMASVLQRAPARSWSDVWKLIREQPTVGRAAIEELASRESFEVALQLPEDSVADLYIWLEAEFPHREDLNGDGYVTRRQQVGWWRDRLLEVLVQRRTPAAIHALRRLAAELAELEFLRARVRAAETAYADELWVPPTPQQLIALTEARDRRLVHSADQLQSVVLESLARANDRLQGAWPKAWQLWNDEPLRPKGEERLSDWVKDWLDDDLRQHVVATREPQVRPTLRGRGLGARNDIRVDLPANDGRDSVGLIIEVKRCWHPKVFAAMRSQLADDYLTSAGLRHGIYLVGVYGAPGWSGRGSRACARRTLDEWTSVLAKRAASVSRETSRQIEAAVLDVRLRSDRAS